MGASVVVFNNRKKSIIDLFKLLMRRGRDSNPRCPKGHAGFQDQCNQPGSATPPMKFFTYFIRSNLLLIPLN